MAETLVLQNATIFDSTGREPYGPGTVVISGDRITAVGPANQVQAPRDARVIDAGNHTVMPGLIDAHTHVGAVDNSFGANFEDRHPGAIYAFSVARILRETLMAGFTTIRDAGGCDYSFKLAVESGTIPGPRIFTSQAYISQTGGHGDMRQRHDRGDPGRAIGLRHGLPFATACPRCVKRPGSNCALAPTSSRLWPAGSGVAHRPPRFSPVHRRGISRRGLRSQAGQEKSDGPRLRPRGNQELRGSRCPQHRTREFLGRRSGFANERERHVPRLDPDGLRLDRRTGPGTGNFRADHRKDQLCQGRRASERGNRDGGRGQYRVGGRSVWTELRPQGR